MERGTADSEMKKREMRVIGSLEEAERQNE